MLDKWNSILICPDDQTPLDAHLGSCPNCGFKPETVPGRTVLDFRAQQIVRQRRLTFTLPVQPLDRSAVLEKYFRAPQQHFEHYSRRDIRRKFGTKLDKGIQFYCQQLLRDNGPDAPILDLGCGSGGSTRYLQSLGFKNVLPVDWSASGAEMLVDAHSLPFATGSFQMILSTAVFEHLYNPFLAMSEIGRVLMGGGVFVGGASFWEAWHGSSYFHLTPDGWHALFLQVGMDMEDLWPGWGIIPAALTHVLTPGYFRGAGYVAQHAVEAVYRAVLGVEGQRSLQLRASGSYQVYARKR